MSKIWPFAFFPGMKSSDTPKEEDIPEVEAVVEEAVEEADAEQPLPEDDVDDFGEETAEADADEDDEDDDLPEFEAELEIALEEAHQEAVKKQRTQNKVIAGLAILTAAGLATGFGIRAYLKRR